jgi:putative tryptophan/tyrosine transport system substrate-binding protein
VRRRDFIALFGGAATVWPFGAGAQQTEQKKRIGVLNSLAETDAGSQAWDTAFRKRLNELGWIEGRNIQLDYRWAAGKVERLEEFAKELIRLKPDVLVSVSTPATAALRAETNVVPIVFAVVSDPVGSGFVASLAKPSGNITGFSTLEASLSGKWLELMHDIAPNVKRVGFWFNPSTAPFARYYLDTFRSAAPVLGMEPIEAPVSSQSCRDRSCHDEGRSQWWRRFSCYVGHLHDCVARNHIFARQSLSVARDLRISFVCRRRWLDVLWSR